MTDLTTSYPLLTLVPPVLAITLVIITKKVLISLGSGVLAAALLIEDLNPLDGAVGVWKAFAGIFWDDGAVNTWYVYILLFTLLLGVIAAFIMMSGGTMAFAEWAVRRIERRRNAMILPAVLGIVIFIDDYFNALAVGQISRPVTDRHNVSRAKLAYIIDSTSAPVGTGVVKRSVPSRWWPPGPCPSQLAASAVLLLTRSCAEVARWLNWQVRLAAVEPDPAGAEAFLQQQGGDEEAALDEEQLDPEERPGEQTRVRLAAEGHDRVVEDERRDGHAAQAVEGRLVADAEVDPLLLARRGRSFLRVLLAVATRAANACSPSQHGARQ
jgi:hypothetical protein